MIPSNLHLYLSIASLICLSAFAGVLYCYKDFVEVSPSTAGSCESFKAVGELAASDGESVVQNEASAREGAVASDSEGNFDAKNCNVMSGKWVFNSTANLLYTDRSCSYLDKKVKCSMNGRRDSNYPLWEWQPDDCKLPRFDASVVLERLRGKRLMFVGDSLQRAQWQSFICLVESHIPADKKSMKRGRQLSVFSVTEYNTTIEFYWAPFLVESNSDVHIIADPQKRILSVDSVAKHAANWEGVDILVFNTYVWWQTGHKIKSKRGSHANREEGYEPLDVLTAYRIGLKTWANWVDSHINPNKTRVFFTTMSPLHMRRSDWTSEVGVKCFNETEPIQKKGYWGSGSDRQMMSVVESIVKRMEVVVSFINITQLSEYRVDGHTSVYTDFQGKLLTAEQKSDPQKYADCIHWCLPGVPDTWNQIFYALL